MRTFAALMVVLFWTTSAAEAKKPKTPAGPILGWHREEAWTLDCWYPPDFSTMPEGPKRMAWQESRDAIMGQWRGERNDGVSLKNLAIDDLETVMLSKGDRIETVARENLDQCKAFAASGNTSEWDSWLVKSAGRLTEGECPYAPMDYTLFNYLSVSAEWQIPVQVCRGNKVIVHGTPGDYYQLQKGGPWINVTGDVSQPAGTGLPCNVEGCFRGQLIMRFTGDSGVQRVLPVGEAVEFLAPEHGQIMVMINDDTFDDNKFKIEAGLEHHTGIEVKPAGGK